MPSTLDPQAVLRARARRAHLDRTGGDAIAIAGALVGLHATDPATAHLSVFARQPIRPMRAVIDELRVCMEERRALLRLMGMRRTLHIVDAGLAPAVLTLARERLGADCRKNATKYLGEAAAPAYDTFRQPVLDALADTDLDTDALQAAVPALVLRVSLSTGKTYASDAPVSRFVLEAMGTSGDLVRARVKGGWRSGRTTWARLDRWAPGLAAAPPRAEAYTALAEAWLRAFAPGTLEDLAWWSGLPKGESRDALRALGTRLVEVEVRGWPGPRYALAETELEDPGPPLPPALLPALDPSGMCWTDRGPFLDPQIAGPLWDNTGNLAPTVWVDGRVVGGWACRKDGTVLFRVLDDQARRHEGAIAEEARRLQEALDGEAILPRFPTPLTKCLAA